MVITTTTFLRPVGGTSQSRNGTVFYIIAKYRGIPKNDGGSLNGVILFCLFPVACCQTLPVINQRVTEKTFLPFMHLCQGEPESL